MSKGPQPLVLVVDPEAGPSAALGPALRREGYQIRIARDGARALQLAVARLPDVIVVGEGTPIVAPRTLVRILRSNPRTAPVRIVYAGTDVERTPDGVDAFVRKPVNADEVLAAIRDLLRGTSTAPDAERLEGSLVQLPLPDVLQMLGNNGRSGRLRISSDDARSDIAFAQGEIVDAVTNGATGEKALFRALSMRNGRFVFQPSEWNGVRRIHRGVAELLLDGLRVVDEMAAVGTQLPPREALLARAPEVAPAQAGPLADEVRALLSAPQCLGDVLDRLSGTDADGARTLAALLASGELTVSEPPLREAAAAGPFLAQADVQALRNRLRSAPGPALAVGKVLLAGGDTATRRAAIERLRAFDEFRADDPAVELGTVGAFQFTGVRLDVVLLPSDPLLLPLWGVLAAGALGAVVLGSSEETWAAISGAHVPAARCGPAPAGADPAGAAGDYLGPDVAEALRALVTRAVSRARPS